MTVVVCNFIRRQLQVRSARSSLSYRRESSTKSFSGPRTTLRVWGANASIHGSRYHPLSCTFSPAFSSLAGRADHLRSPQSNRTLSHTTAHQPVLVHNISRELNWGQKTQCKNQTKQTLTIMQYGCTNVQYSTYSGIECME